MERLKSLLNMYEYCDNAWLRFAIIIHKQILEKMDINVGYSTE